ncbi:MAG: pyruvate kinase [Deltaproteobacteria bacterium]|nr:pyruvate kinase [Deltaproteobacteria bacterium]
MERLHDKRKTKIVATIGPSSSSPDVIENLLLAGVNVFRLNLSHGKLDTHSEAVSRIRAASRRLALPVSILMDLQGPKIRVGKLKAPVELKRGQKITISAEEPDGDEKILSTTYKDLYRDVKPGDRILLDDGIIEARVLGVTGLMVECEVVYGGLLKENKGMNLPGVNVSAPSLSQKDIEDIKFGVSHGVDYIALSFVRKASDIVELKERLKEQGADIPVIAKIEKAEAVANLDAIFEEADGIMIARGDLGVELAAEEVPVLQKKLISKANEAGKLVITATQMLESMIENPRPTRAEASDVANAVFDGTDALMLSGETAVGKYPIKAVEMMVKIAREAEEAALAQKHLLRRKKPVAGSFAQAVAFAANAASNEVNSKAIVVFTQTGETARLLSKLRPTTRIIAFTPLETTWRRLALVWGVEPFTIEFGLHTDEMICRGEAALLDYGIAGLGDTIVVVSGTKVGMRGATNMMKIDWIGSEECKLYLKGRDG